ncbi:MAG: 2-amino-4-hydroxy-6-hydroxymethyldihydropteridine diphosphokinase [Bacillota bacterium]|nr:2-amino-4-hydroxy-6-hydroxymethyldihydropteridine diphosphokinase [Bacillota bacterium]
MSIGLPVENNYKNIEKALTLLKAFKETKFSSSEYYLSHRFSLKTGDDIRYFNICVFMDSELHPFDLLEKISGIQRRTSGTSIKILWISGVEILSNQLRVPDDKLLSRAYVLHPLQELAKLDGRLMKFINGRVGSIEDSAEKISKYQLRRM